MVLQIDFVLSLWPLHKFASVWFLWIDSQRPLLMTRLSLNKQQITLTAKLRTTSFQWTHVNVCLYRISMIFCRLECGLCQNSVEIENNSSALSCLHILHWEFRHCLSIPFIHIGRPVYCFVKTKRPQPIVNATPTYQLFRPGWKHQIAMMYCCGKPANPTPMLQVQSSRVPQKATPIYIDQTYLQFYTQRYTGQLSWFSLLDPYCQAKSNCQQG